MNDRQELSRSTVDRLARLMASQDAHMSVGAECMKADGGNMVLV